MALSSGSNAEINGGLLWFVDVDVGSLVSLFWDVLEFAILGASYNCMTRNFNVFRLPIQ